MNKTKRRIFTAIISCFLALTMVFSVACGGDKDNAPATAYTVTVRNSEGNSLVRNSDIQVTFTGTDTSETYSVALGDSGSVSVPFDTLDAVVTSETKTVTISNYTNSSAEGTYTVSRSSSSVVIYLKPLSIDILHNEYVSTYSAISIENWFLKVLTSASLTDSALSVTYANGRVTVNFELKTDIYTIAITDGNMVFTTLGVSTAIGAYTADVVDQNGNKVQDVCLCITWYDSSESTLYTYDRNYSNADGKVIMYAPVVSGRGYRLQTQNLTVTPVVVPAGVTTPIPSGYVTPVDPSTQTASGIVNFGNSKSATYTLNYFPSDFDIAIHKFNHNYARYIFGENTDGVFGAGAQLSNVQERNVDLVLSVESGIYSYVGFSPFVEPGAGDVTGLDSGVDPSNSNRPEQQAQIAARKAAADAASSGTYRISLNTSDTSARLIFFTSTYAQNAEGVPTNIGYITGSGSENYYTGTNYIDLNVRTYGSENRSTYWFGIISDNDCSATIEVERIGDAVEPAAAEVHVVSPHVTPTQYTLQGATSTTTRNDMPIDGIYTAVMGTDNYYHVNSATGPILHVQLTKNMSRVFSDSTVTLANLPENNDRQETVYQFNERNDLMDSTIITDVYDYVDFVETYSSVADTNTGLYPVNEEIKAFLERLAGSGIGSCVNTAATGYAWLSYCQYVGDTLAPGSGTADNPYTLVVGDSNVTISSSAAHLRVTLNRGVFRFRTNSENATLNYTGSLANIVSEGYLVLTVQSDNTVVELTLSGTPGVYVVSIGTTSVRESTIEDEQQGTRNLGISAATAIPINFSGVITISSLSESNINSGYDEFTYINLRAFLSSDIGTYELIVNGTGTLVCGDRSYTNGQVCEVALTTSTPVLIKISSSEDSEFVDSYVMLIIRKKASTSGN